MGIHFSHILGIVWISASPKIFEKPITLECLCFPIFFSYYGNSLFPYFGNCMDFCFTQNSWETHYFGMFVFSHTFPVLWEFTFPHVLRIAWISASSEIFKKPINLKYLCFPILSPYYGNPLFLCFWNCMGFCFTQNIWETQNFQMFVFFTYFSGIMRIHVSHVLGTVWIFASWEKFWKPLTLKCLCFPIFSPYYGNSLFFPHILGLVWINASHEICIRNIALECLCFPIRSPYYVNSVFPYYRNCMGFYITRNRVVRNM